MPPTPLETQELALLEKLEQRLQSLGGQRAALQGQLDRISNERAFLQTEYGLLHNSRVAAISRLPDELLSEVFRCLHQSQNLLSITADNPRSDGQQANLWRAEAVLSKVCIRWRTITLSMPSLWSLFLCNKPFSCACLITELARLRNYLQRSGAHDLELFFDFTCPEAYEPYSRSSLARFKQLVQEILTAAVEHAERWRQLTIIANDSRRRVSLTPLKADIWTPRLERLVVCTGEPHKFGRLTAQDDGWDPQVLLLHKGDSGGPCPKLRYLKLDGAGLLSCRPCLVQLTHLVLEYGNAEDQGRRNELLIEWPALVRILLRPPHLESLSLCERMLSGAGFPASPSDPAYYLDFPALKHLRLGSTLPEEGWDGMESKLFWFLLRYVAASHLETLEISSFIIGQSPWSSVGNTWPNPAFVDLDDSCKDTSIFPSLHTLTISDIKIHDDRISRLGFLLMERMSHNAHTLILSDYYSSLKSVVSRVFPFNEEGGFTRDRTLWPGALDISINFEIHARDPNHCLEEYASWCLEIINGWENVQVLRLPPIWIDMWLSRLKQPINILNPPFRPSNFVWENGQQTALVEEGTQTAAIGREEEGVESDDEGGGPWALRTFDTSISGHPVRIIPLEEVISRCWPPGSQSTPFNTLYSEQFDPFRVEVGNISADGTVYD